MCVEVPLELVEVRPDGTALARAGIPAGPTAAASTSAGRLVEVNLLTLDGPVTPGEWVLAHSGFALHRVSAAAVRDALAIRAVDL